MPPRKPYRFAKGQSGNPAGRPPGGLGLKRIFERENNRRITVTVDGRPKRMTIREAIALRIAMGAARGDPRMISLAIETDLIEKLEPAVIHLFPDDIEDEDPAE